MATQENVKTEHTPGPWHIVTNKYGEHVLVETATDDNIFLLDDTESAFLYQPCLANARLMAAAPDLYAALVALMDCWPEGTLPAGPVCVQASRALAKARGMEDC